MTHMATFDELFSAEFDGGLKDIKFFVNPEVKVSADDLRADAAAFQSAINQGLVQEVDSVD